MLQYVCCYLLINLVNEGPFPFSHQTPLNLNPLKLTDPNSRPNPSFGSQTEPNPRVSIPDLRNLPASLRESKSDLGRLRVKIEK